MKNRYSNELTVCGQKAVDKIAKVHPERVHRLFFNADLAPQYGEVCRYMAANRRIYRMVDNIELEKVAGSIHHGGVAAVIDLPRLEEPGPLEINTWCNENRRLIVLDSVANSHNLGSIVRTAAFLGIQDIVVSGSDQDDHLVTSAMYRTAEGGMEHVSLWRISNLVDFMERSRFQPNRSSGSTADRGIAFIAADHHAKLDLAQLPDKLKEFSSKDVAIAMVMGNEETGIRREVNQRCILAARIVGSGNLESLNVAQAAAIFMFALGRG